MPSADFCTAFARLAACAVQFGSKDPQGTRCRPPEVSSIAFRTLPPEFTSDVLDGYGLRGNLPARPPPAASYPVLVHWLVRLLALPSDPVSRRQPLRFAILHLHQVGARTFTSPAIEHARHTGFARCARLLTRTNQKTRRLQSLFQKRRAQAGWAKSEYRCGRPRCIRWNGPFNLATTDKNDCHENRND